MHQTAGMKHDLADKWSERLLVLQAQLERETGSATAWHWRCEAKVLRFLLRRYGEVEAPLTAPDDAATPPPSALEHSLLRLALLIPNVANKHLRPAPRDRAAILERIKCARDEGRAIEEAEESWWDNINVQIEAGVDAHRNTLRLREREEEWKRTQHERLREERERRRRG